MAAGSGDFQSSARRLLAFELGEVGIRRRVRWWCRPMLG
jgi:hypothetical protein